MKIPSISNVCVTIDVNWYLLSQCKAGYLKLTSLTTLLSSTSIVSLPSIIRINYQ